MSLLFATSWSPIGVDLGGRTIKLAQLRRRRGVVQLHSAVSVAQPEANHPVEEPTARHIRDLLARHGFIGNRLVLAAPNDQLEVDVLELPPRDSGAPIEQIARMELGRAAKFENDPFELEFWDLPASSRGGAAETPVMAVAMRHQHAEALLNPFDAVGLHVQAIDARCCALARAATSCSSPDGITAVLDMGWNAALLVLIRDGVVLYQRRLADSGLWSAFNAISQEFDLDQEATDYVLKKVGIADESSGNSTDLGAMARAVPRVRQIVGWLFEAMLGQIETVLQYARHRYAQTPVTNLLLVGGGASVAGVNSFIGSSLRIEQSRVLGPASIVQCPPDLLSRCSDGMLTGAVGLAMYQEE